jgi:thiosulfate reductase cytochrome b subunit
MRSRPVQPWLIRLTHWVDAAVLVIMAGSGLRILAAYPSLGERGAPYAWYPFHGVAPPPELTVGVWLAGARHIHFAFAWILIANALAYLVYVFASGEWRRRLFLPRRDARHALGTFLGYLHVRPMPPREGLYNGLQRLAYTSALLLGALVVVSGLALLDPVQLPRLTALLGGYDAARAIHLLSLASLAAFTIVHVVQVLLHPRTLVDMTAGRREKIP